MKYYCLLLFFLFFLNSFSQDVIIMNDGNKIEAKIKEITDSEISYLRFDLLEGPIFVAKIKKIKEVIFENGTSLSFSGKENIEAMSIQETKTFIVQSVNNFAFQRDGDKAYTADFEGKYLKLSRRNIESGEIYENYRLYDFSSKCDFHSLSKRENDLSYINVYVPRIVNDENRTGYKLVILVKGHENGQLLLSALKKYNEFFKED